MYIILKQNRSLLYNFYYRKDGYIIDDMKRLFAALVLYRHNLQVLHWKSAGTGFDRVHSLCNEYYDKFGDFIDSIAEKIVILGGNPLGLEECLANIKSQETQFLCSDPALSYKKEDAFNEIAFMLDSIIKEYNVVLDNNDLPKGMRSSMESDLEWLEVESAYKTKQRLL